MKVFVAVALASVAMTLPAIPAAQARAIPISSLHSGHFHGTGLNPNSPGGNFHGTVVNPPGQFHGTGINPNPPGGQFQGTVVNPPVQFHGTVAK